MTPGEFILLSVAITAAVLALAWSASKPVKKEAPPAPGRWRRFRIDPAAIHSAGGGTPVVEEPSGLRLAREGGPQSGRRLTLAGGGTLIDIAPPWLFPGSRLNVKTGGQALGTVARGKRGEPAVTFRSAPGATPYQVGGDPAGAEYDVRREGRVVAVVFHEPDRTPGSRGAYFVEVLRSEDPLPVLAIVIAAEACLGPRT